MGNDDIAAIGVAFSPERHDLLEVAEVVMVAAQKQEWLCYLIARFIMEAEAGFDEDGDLAFSGDLARCLIDVVLSLACGGGSLGSLA